MIKTHGDRSNCHIGDRVDGMPSCGLRIDIGRMTRTVPFRAGRLSVTLVLDYDSGFLVLLVSCTFKHPGCDHLLEGAWDLVIARYRGRCVSVLGQIGAPVMDCMATCEAAPLSRDRHVQLLDSETSLSGPEDYFFTCLAQCLHAKAPVRVALQRVLQRVVDVKRVRPSIWCRCCAGRALENRSGKR